MTNGDLIHAYYTFFFGLSLVLTLLYMFRWHKHDDIHITLIFVLVPVVNLGSVLLSHAGTLEEATALNKLSYVGGCFLELMVMLTVFSLCDLHVPHLLKFGFLLLSTVIFVTSLSAGFSPIFYADMQFRIVDGVSILHKEYGWMHSVFLGMVCLYFILSIAAIIYSFFRKNQVSRKILILLFLPEAIAFIAYYAGRRAIPHVELLSAAYVLGQVVYLVISSRMSLYDVEDTAIDSLAANSEIGLISVDFKRHYLGSNRAAREAFPALERLTVDRRIAMDQGFYLLTYPWLKDFEEDQSRNTFFYDRGDLIYRVDLSWLYNNKKKKGYQMTVTDDTEARRHVNKIEADNDVLEKLVDEKTRHIVEMHDQLILGMATMVESRDNSTGGHIRRTSDGVRMLLEAADESGSLSLSKTFREKLIKAAPMHDLGKIAVDDQILRKPGRFEPWEYEIMKSHAAKGARIVHEILKGTDDDEFHLIAENVAQYHHERWDGLGYPCGLKGEEIPLEARIMAVADVYDALVSKRVYKERMSFEKADAIMMEGMGTQFAPEMRPVYMRARPRLEAYYSSLSDS